ncbi:MAG TPA: LacI family transcriptional regulator, partial [Sarcina sp.]|nr:LacI family transcriptional regulator [Sarcina sp.]
MIAEKAGVSRGTVDRVLNNRSYVKADVKERVLKIAKQMGYVSQRE